ncbi:MAG: radical SAM protein [Moraxellaceae bacterium]|nr:radical SAM protein [Moraxellaceae bacterium]
MPELRITEIFHSLQGEARSVGRPTVFVRLTGCPLRCTWCDTPYSFSGGSLRTLDDIVQEIHGHGAHHVCVTGGEPLAQPECLALLGMLCEAGFEVSLETSGALDISRVDKRVSRHMTTDFVLDALEQALHARRFDRAGDLIPHSDRCSQYVSISYTERLAEAGIEPSVGSKGDSYDNALAETINGLYKTELIHRQPCKSREAVEMATLQALLFLALLQLQRLIQTGFRGDCKQRQAGKQAHKAWISHCFDSHP